MIEKDKPAIQTSTPKAGRLWPGRTLALLGRLLTRTVRRPKQVSSRAMFLSNPKLSCAICSVHHLGSVAQAVLLTSIVLLVQCKDSFAELGFPYPKALNNYAGSDLSDDNAPRIVSAGSGFWLAVWTSEQDLGGIGTDEDILISRSENNGKHWTPAVPLNNDASTDVSGDRGCNLATDGKGNCVAVWERGSSYYRTIMVSRSANHGATWTAPTIVSSALHHSIAPWVATDGYGDWVVVWTSNDSLGATIDFDLDILVSRSTDNGATWSAPSALNTNAATDSGDDRGAVLAVCPRYTRWVQLPDGRWMRWWMPSEWVVMWTSEENLRPSGWLGIGTDPDILVSHSTNGGETWAAPAPLNNYAFFDSGDDYSSAALAGHAGNWVAMWVSYKHETYGADSDILFSRSTDAGASWTPAEALAPYASTDSAGDQVPCLTTDGRGHWAAVWASMEDINGAIGADYDLLMSLSSDNGVNWTVPAALNGQAAAGSAHDWVSSIATDGSGHWMVAWESAENFGGIGTDDDIVVSNAIPPVVTSIECLDGSPTAADWIRFHVSFSKKVTGVGPDDFEAEVVGIAGGDMKAVYSAPPPADEYTVQVNAGDGDGTIKLNLVDDGTIKDEYGHVLGGWGINGGFTEGQAYTIGASAPAVASIERADQSPTDADFVSFEIVFTEDVTGVDIGDFAVSPTGNVGAPYVSEVTGAGTTYDVTVNTGTGTGTINLKLNDDDSIRDTDTPGIPLGDWGANDVLLEQAKYVVDKTEPETTSAVVEGSDGPYTRENSELFFTWSGFVEEDVTEIAHYLVKLCTKDGSSCSETKEIDYPLDTCSFLPADLDPSFDVFPNGKYVFAISAVNLVGLHSEELSTEVTVDSTAYKVGEQIPLPAGWDWADIDWVKTTFEPSTHAILLEQAKKLLMADWGPPVTMTWYRKGSDAPVVRQYNTASAPIKRAMIIYWTHIGTERTRMPGVNIARVQPVKIHYNETIPENLKVGEEVFWIQGDYLYARGPVARDPAYVILQYDAEGNDLEIVQVKANLPEGDPIQAHVGSRLHPVESVSEPNWAAPQVTRNENNEYIYQHEIHSRQKGQVWSIRKNNDAVNMEVVWMRKGLGDVEWPYELRRYKAKWPEDRADKYQLYVRGESPAALGPKVTVPSELNAEGPLDEEFHNPLHHAHREGNSFYADGPGWFLLRYQTGPTPGQDWVGFEVIRCFDHHDPNVLGHTEEDEPVIVGRDIGTEITDDYHQGPRPGYVHEPEGDRYAAEIYSDTGQIFAVNTGIIEVWWYNLSRVEDPEGTDYPAWPSDPSLRVQWPSKVMRYRADWPTDPNETGKIIIANLKGSGPIDETRYGEHLTSWDIYDQPDDDEPGFNPNDEHALVLDGKIFAMRDDLYTPATSQPYVLMKYKEQPANGWWRFRVFAVVREEDPYYFHKWQGYTVLEDPYKQYAGLKVQPPLPLTAFVLTDAGVKVEGVGEGPWWLDRKGDMHIIRAGIDGTSTVDFKARFWYPVQPSFYFPEGLSFPYSHDVDELVPWLDSASGSPTGTPIDITYTAYWPDEAGMGKVKIGQTVINGGSGVPAIDGQGSVDILFDQSEAQGGGQSATLVDPVRVRVGSVIIEEDDFPPDIEIQKVKMKDGRSLWIFPRLSLALRERVGYDPETGKLEFWGVIMVPDFGDDYPILNVMSTNEKAELCALDDKNPECTDSLWDKAVADLYEVAREPVSDIGFDDTVALTAGFAEGTGYVTLVFKNSEECGDLPVEVKIIKVVPELYTGTITAIYPDCAFDETITLRHSGDFGGRPGDYRFQWIYMPDPGHQPAQPAGDYAPSGWMAAVDANGAIDYTIRGANLLTISDNYFAVRYQYTPEGLPWSKRWSDWTVKPMLAEGWIKRVVGDINGYTQGGTSGGVQGGEILGPIESRFHDFGDKTDTVIDMISNAGEPWDGDVPLSCDNLDDFGLIEIYQTVLNRGAKLSISASFNYGPANTALLLVASRIADLYALLGNEAYADAADPTIAFGVEGQYGAAAACIHCFMNVEGGSTMIEEELSLLRGRDDSGSGGGVQSHPLYNRLLWNYTNGLVGGEVAYSLNYNLHDVAGNEGEPDGEINIADARELFPQGHGDAWGHYLTATKTYYKLITHPNYTWDSRSETLVVGGKSWTVDYYDERKFASVAAAKARTGAEIVNLSYRSAYVEDPAGQWQGYKDRKPERAWGLSEWASRAGQGAYFDWVVGNAILPPSSNKEGIEKIDRTTVLELRDVASRYVEIQTQADIADIGLNPLGLATNVIPFGISAAGIDDGKTHFEQIYGRAAAAMNNAIAVFNHATNSTQALRRQKDSQIQFERTVSDRRNDFKNRLIEIFGYPYSGDPAASDLDGPDLQNYDCITPSEILGIEALTWKQIPLIVKSFTVLDDGSLAETEKPVTFYISTDADPLGCVRPDASWGSRRAPGEIQLAKSALLQERARFQEGLVKYNNLIDTIEDQADLLKAQHNLDAEEINVLNLQLDQQERLNSLIQRSRSRQLNFRKRARLSTIVANAVAEALPTSAGWSFDVTSVARSAIRLAGTVMSEMYTQDADRESLVELDHQQAHQIMQARTNITLTTQRKEHAILQQVQQLEQAVREEASLRLELYSLQEALQQALGRYKSALARGERLIEDHRRFERQTASEVQSRRYKDMAFRVFRNDALQKYRAQFDMAARYVYLAAKAYDYDTTFLDTDSRAGQEFLTSIVAARLIGTINQDGTPLTGKGLADPMARMYWNFWQIKPDFDNPQRETNRLSLRSELFRISRTASGDVKWRETLWRSVAPNILGLPEFRRYCALFHPHKDIEPGIVIAFETNINEGLNVFGWPTDVGGLTSYDSSHYTTKIRSVGVWFSNYNSLMQGGLSEAPRVYLIPVGTDVQRSRTGDTGKTREFNILDQELPEPFPIGGGQLSQPDWIPAMEPPMDTYADIRKHSRLRAYHDSGDFDDSELEKRDSQLIGRSVWNTRWLLIIPASTLLNDRDEGLRRFIDGAGGNGNGVSDIKIIFETYAY